MVLIKTEKITHLWRFSSSFHFSISFFLQFHILSKLLFNKIGCLVWKILWASEIRITFFNFCFKGSLVPPLFSHKVDDDVNCAKKINLCSLLSCCEGMSTVVCSDVMGPSRIRIFNINPNRTWTWLTNPKEFYKKKLIFFLTNIFLNKETNYAQPLNSIYFFK